MTHYEGGGLRQTCWASSCPAASQCPRRGGTWVGHNGTSPPTSGSLVQPGCFSCPELLLSSCALQSGKQSCDRDTRVHTNPASIPRPLENSGKIFQNKCLFLPQMFIVGLLSALAGVVGRHWAVSQSPQPRRACKIRPAWVRAQTSASTTACLVSGELGTMAYICICSKPCIMDSGIQRCFKYYQRDSLSSP